MEKVSNKIKSKGNQKISQDPRSIIPQGKKTLILGDSTVKHVEGWWLNKRKKSTVSARCISGATINAMKQFKGCLEDSSPYNIIFHHGTNNLKSNDNSKKKKKNCKRYGQLGLIGKSEKAMVYISSLIMINKLDKKRK